MSWAGVAAAGISAGASVYNAGATGKLNKKNRRFQREMFDKTNAYNHPLAQRQRLEEAGMNPNLMYGRGDVGNASMPNMPDGSVPTIDMSETANQISSLFQKKLAQQSHAKQLEQADANIDKTKAEAELVKQRTNDIIEERGFRLSNPEAHSDPLYSTPYYQARMQKDMAVSQREANFVQQQAKAYESANSLSDQLQKQQEIETWFRQKEKEMYETTGARFKDSLSERQFLEFAKSLGLDANSSGAIKTIINQLLQIFF